MRVLVACEFSGKIRDAFIKKGHEALSCDFYNTLSEGPHYKGDVRDIINDGWDLMIAHPPCTYLALSGARHFHKRIKEQEEALGFVQLLMDANIPKICIENPIGVISSKIRKPTQIIQPYEYGHREVKPTCLWLKGLEPLKPTNIVEKVNGKWDNRNINGNCNIPGCKNKRMLRSITYQGIAVAMAEQWG